MAYLKFDVDVDTWVTRKGDPDVEWDFDSTDGAVTVSGCHLLQDDVYDALPATFNVRIGDHVWLVWAQYSTGDSFATYGGKYELCSVFSNYEEAERELLRLGDITDYSVPWNGFFENLDFIKIEEFKVKA